MFKKFSLICKYLFISSFLILVVITNTRYESGKKDFYSVRIISKEPFELQRKILEINEVANRKKMEFLTKSLIEETKTRGLSILMGFPIPDNSGLKNVVVQSIELEAQRHILRLETEYSRIKK